MFVEILMLNIIACAMDYKRGAGMKENKKQWILGLCRSTKMNLLILSQRAL